MMTLWNGAFSAGFAVSAALFGLVAEWRGYRQVFSIAGVSTLAAVVMLMFERSRVLLPPAGEGLDAKQP
jgi:predicted MFS family arabinose efflux permease